LIIKQCTVLYSEFVQHLTGNLTRQKSLYQKPGHKFSSDANDKKTTTI